MQKNLFAQDQVCHSNLAEIEIKYSTRMNSSEMEFAINPIDEKIPQIKSQQNLVIRKEHVFSVDFRNRRTALTMISIGLVISLSSLGNIWQLNWKNQLKDNDLNVISKFLRKHLKGFAPVENCEQTVKEQTGKLENKR